MIALITRAFAVLTVQDVSLAGLNPSYAAAGAGGDSFPNDGATFLHVKNGGGGPITVTIDDVGSASPEAAAAFDPDPDVSVPAGEERMIGPFPKDRFDATDGTGVNVSYSGVTSVTVAAVSAR